MTSRFEERGYKIGDAFTVVRFHHVFEEGTKVYARELCLNPKMVMVSRFEGDKLTPMFFAGDMFDIIPCRENVNMWAIN